MSKKIIGIDYSITSPAITIMSENGVYLQSFFLSKVKSRIGSFLNGKIISEEYPSYHSDEERYHHLMKWSLNHIQYHPFSDVYLEGYSYGSKGKVFNLAENMGVLKYAMWSSGIEFHIVEPTTVKKFATGKGNSKKHILYDEFLKITGINLVDELGMKSFSSPADDIVDSYWIAKWGTQR